MLRRFSQKRRRATDLAATILEERSISWLMDCEMDCDLEGAALPLFQTSNPATTEAFELELIFFEAA